MRVWDRGGGVPRRSRRLALVALGEESERVNLPNEVGHAGPTTKPKPDHKNPNHNEGIEHIHCSPAW